MSFQVAFLRDSPPPLCTTRRRLRAKPTGSAWDGEMPRPCGHVWGGTTATATAFHCISAQVTKCDNLEMFILHSSKYFFSKTFFTTPNLHQLFNSSLKMLSWNQDLWRSLKALRGSPKVDVIAPWSRKRVLCREFEQFPFYVVSFRVIFHVRRLLERRMGPWTILPKGCKGWKHDKATSMYQWHRRT